MGDRVFQDTVAEWIADCYRPGGYYEKRIGECVEAVWRRSPELTALRNSRLLRLNAAVRYLLQAAACCVEQGLPLLGAVGGGWLGCRLLQQPAFAAAAEPESAAAAAAEPAAAELQLQQTSAAAAADPWSLASFLPTSLSVSLPSLPSYTSLQQTAASAAANAGSWLGDKVNTVLSATYTFTTDFIGHSFALPQLQQTAVHILVPVLCAVAAYWAGWLLARFLQNLFVLVHKERQLQQMQQMFLQESRALVHRTLTDKVRPPLLQSLHTLLVAPAARYKAYAPTYELLRHAIYDTLLEDLKELEFSRLLAKHRGHSRYFNGLYFLMRNAEEEVARLLFAVCQEMATVEGDPVSRLVDQGRRRLQALTAA